MKSISQTNLPTKYGVFCVRAFRDVDSRSTMCNCRDNMEQTLKTIQKTKAGIAIYVPTHVERDSTEEELHRVSAEILTLMNIDISLVVMKRFEPCSCSFPLQWVSPLSGIPQKSKKHKDFLQVLTLTGNMRVRVYRSNNGAECVVMSKGVVEGQKDVPIRVHDQCLTSEVWGSLKCDCKDQLDASLSFIAKQKCGMVIYLCQEGRGIGLANKIAAYSLQEQGFDTVDANRKLGLPDDIREYSYVLHILNDLKVESICLLTNNPRKISKLTELGVTISTRMPILTPPNKHSAGYISAKKSRMGHFIDETILIPEYVK